ncbi:MAG: hypothetical protein EON54_04045 [Alcaligenaceae bacterium]|nr:MAG: hypothetical protein EON54_04045 [Alcaligenaceae bacterium]
MKNEPRAAKAPELPEMFPLFSMFGLFNPCVLFLMSLPALTLLLAPDEVLTAVPVLNVLATRIAALVPGLQESASVSEVPQVALLTNSVAVCSTMLIACIFMITMTVGYRTYYVHHKANGPHPASLYGTVLVGAPFFVLLFWAAIGLIGEPSGRSLVGILPLVGLQWITGLCVGSLPTIVRFFLDAWLFATPVTIRK